MRILQCASVCILRITLHNNACLRYFCTLKAQGYTQLWTSHTWVKGLPPFYGLKEGNWHTECLCTPNLFLAQVSRIFKSEALLMFYLKISRDLNQKHGDLGQSTFNKPPLQTTVCGWQRTTCWAAFQKTVAHEERLVKWKVSLVINIKLSLNTLKPS